MKKILGEITSGQFAKEWVNEYQTGLKNFNELYEKDHDSQVETGRPQAAQDDEVDRRQGSVADLRFMIYDLRLSAAMASGSEPNRKS